MGNMDELREALKRLAKTATAAAQAFGEVAETMRQSAAEAARAYEKEREAFLEALNDIYKAAHPEIMDELADFAAEPEEIPRKPERPRPPRYAGPQNKGRTWTRQPPRLARSHCRKMRR